MRWFHWLREAIRSGTASSVWDQVVAGDRLSVRCYRAGDTTNPRGS